MLKQLVIKQIIVNQIVPKQRVLEELVSISFWPGHLRSATAKKWTHNDEEQPKGLPQLTERDPEPSCILKRPKRSKGRRWVPKLPKEHSNTNVELGFLLLRLCDNFKFWQNPTSSAPALPQCVFT